MARYQGWFAFVLALAIAAGMFLVRTPLQLGLDLRGGSQLTVEVRPTGEISVVGDQELEAVKAVEQLESEGVSVELIDLISLKPFDMETISRSIRKTNKVIVVEECMKTGGIGAELIALITEQCFDDLDARPVRLSSQDIPTPYNGSLENLTIIQPHQIVEAAQALVNKGI